MKVVTLLFLIAAVPDGICCNSEKNKQVTIQNYLLPEKDIIPEGLAFDALTGTIYVSSTYKRKIIQIDSTGTIRDFIPEGFSGIGSVIGMEVDAANRELWAISAQANEVLPVKNPDSLQWRSAVYRFQIPGGKLIHKYELQKDSVFFNDLTIAQNGMVYITESVQNGIYRIIPSEDTIRLFLQPNPFHFINGITFSNQPHLFFISSTEGIVRVNCITKEYQILPAINMNAGSADGLAFHDRYLLAHQSNKISRFYLSASLDSIIRSDTFDTGPEFDGSTTGEISGEFYYYIVNSQIQSGIDTITKTIKSPEKLRHTLIRKKRL